MKHVQMKVEHGQTHEMATVFGVRRALAAFRSFSLNEKRRQVAALQKLPPFHV
jgi:hypothetical protein